METYRDKIRRKIVEAASDYELIEPSDRIMVCVSGGKDSTILALMLASIRERAPFEFDFSAVILDQKQPGFQLDAYRTWLEARGIPLTVISEDTYSIVKDKVAPGKSYCGLCSRLRRGIFYNYAHANGYTKIALGHHRDDLNQTVLLNLFYSGRMAGMPPKLFADDGRNTVIRPMAYVPEAWLSAYAKELMIPVIPCNLCGSQANLKRRKIKDLLRSLESDFPQLGASLLTAQQNVRPSQLLDRTLMDFRSGGRPSWAGTSDECELEIN